VNRALAERFWPDDVTAAIGQTLRINWDELTPIEIIGVVENVHHYGLDQDPGPMAYLPYEQKPYFPFQTIVVRSALEPGPLAESVAGLVRSMDPSLALADVQTMQSVMDRSVARPRVTAFLTLVFAAAAALLAAIGLYGVLSYSVSRRVREIGIRMALGAAAADTVRRVLREGITLTGVGLVLGLAAAVVLGRTAQSLLFGVQPLDVWSMVGAGALLLSVTALACVVPATRATRVAPADALRRD
jgi:ABC-type antimicrobial peptide transport system permease subunit